MPPQANARESVIDSPASPTVKNKYLALIIGPKEFPPKQTSSEVKSCLSTGHLPWPVGVLRGRVQIPGGPDPATAGARQDHRRLPLCTRLLPALDVALRVQEGAGWQFNSKFFDLVLA